MYQLISSPVVNAPPSSYILRLLNNNKALYVPNNGTRSSPAVTDTKEEMMDIFASDVNGTPREQKRLMNRRGYIACVAFDPEVVSSAFQGATGADAKLGVGGRLSIAVDFMIQGEGGGGSSAGQFGSGTVKYGPVIVPSLEFGR
jgi:hypothetical protein